MLVCEWHYFILLQISLIYGLIIKESWILISASGLNLLQYAVLVEIYEKIQPYTYIQLPKEGNLYDDICNHLSG